MISSPRHTFHQRRQRAESDVTILDVHVCGDPAKFLIINHHAQTILNTI